jgi:hypothetical protein
MLGVLETLNLMFSHTSKDRLRAKILLEQSNFDYIDSLLRKFDKDEILKKRLSTL